MVPPVQVEAVVVNVPPLPVTVKLPVAADELLQTMPLAAPLAEMDRKVNVPSEFTKLTAVEAPVFMLTPLTVRPVALLAESVPVIVGVLAVLPVMVRPLTVSVAPAPISD